MIVYGPNFRYLKPSEQPAYVPGPSESELAEIRYAERRKERREQLKAELLADPNHEKHGTGYAYNCGCRCEKCKQARSDYMRVRAKRNGLL